MSQEVLLSVKDLRTEFFSSKTSSVTAIKDVSFDMYRGEVLGLVGESGCGKSVTSLSIMQLLKDTPGKVTNGSATASTWWKPATPRSATSAAAR